MSEKTAEQLIAESVNAAADKAAESVEVVKSVAASIEKGFTAIAEKLEPKPVEGLEVLKSEIALIKAKQEAGNAGVAGGNSELEEKSKETLKSFASAVLGKSLVKVENTPIFNSCGVLEQKSLVTFDNTGVGAFVPAKRLLGEININLQTVNPVTSIVDNVNAGPVVAQELGYKTFDSSYVRIYESGEIEGKTETPQTKEGDVVIHVMQNSAKIKISDKTLHSAGAGELSLDPIAREFREIERFYEKKIARQILNGAIGMGINGIFPAAHKSGFRGKVVATANDNYITLKDLAMLSMNLKSDYLRNAAILIDRKALYDLYFDEADDGHLRIEQFDYANGIASLRTPERVIPLIGVDSSCLDADVALNDGFGNYTSFADGSSAILSGYSPRYNTPSGASDNAGKAVAVLADFNAAYALARSSVTQVGYDSSFGNLLQNGYVWGGKIGYVGGKVKTEEAITILYVQ